MGDIVGLHVFFEKSAPSDVLVKSDTTILAQLDPEFASQVALAIDRGVRFTGTIEKTFLTYDEGTWKPTGSQLDIKWEYQLQKGEPPIKPPRQFFTKVAGVTFEGRQNLIGRCSVGETLILVREPDNPKDKGAIKVLRTNGEQLGYIPRLVSCLEDPAGLAAFMDRGNKCECKIINITGGGDLWLGVNIQITKPGEDYDALVQRRLREIAGESVSKTINCSIEATSHDRGEAFRGSSNVTLLWSALVALVVLAVLALVFFIVSR